MRLFKQELQALLQTSSFWLWLQRKIARWEIGLSVDLRSDNRKNELDELRRALELLWSGRLHVCGLQRGYRVKSRSGLHYKVQRTGFTRKVSRNSEENKSLFQRGIIWMINEAKIGPA